MVGQEHLSDLKTPLEHTLALGSNLYLKKQAWSANHEAISDQASPSSFKFASNNVSQAMQYISLDQGSCMQDPKEERPLDQASAETKLLTTLLSRGPRAEPRPVALDLEIEDPILQTTEPLALQSEENSNYKQQLVSIVDGMDDVKEQAMPTQMEDELLALLDDL